MRRRSGFTITELLVAMALIVFVMSILATAFSEGMRTFRGLKGLGDLNQRMRTAASALRDDLDKQHFDGGRRLSDPNFWSTTAPPEFGPPREGYFRIWQGSALPATVGGTTYVNEGTDVNYGLQSVRATDHALQFTVKKRGNDPKDFFRANVPSGSPLTQFGNYLGRYEDNPSTGVNTFTSQWAEVAWFMRPSGQNANGTPLYTLYRRQRVIVGNPETGGAPGSPGVNLNWTVPGLVAANAYNDLLVGINYLGISCRTSNVGNGEIYFNSPTDLTVPQYRFSMQTGVTGGLPPQATGSYPLGLTAGAYYYYAFQPMNTTGANQTEEWTNPNMTGADAVLTDVVSFTVRVLTPTSSQNPSSTGGFVDLSAQASVLGASSNNPLFGGANGPFVFDTWSSVKNTQIDYSTWNTPGLSTSVPLQVPILAIQIQLRVWDPKTEQSRQLTLIVDM
jgi:prepilin-type N-terminal cleavage/methylation domain-containing protein